MKKEFKGIMIILILFFSLLIINNFKQDKVDGNSVFDVFKNLFSQPIGKEIADENPNQENFNNDQVEKEFVSSPSAGPIIYYVSSSSGNDAWGGKLPNPNREGSDGPWQTLQKVSNAQFQPGDNILFKRGESWKGQLKVSSSGTAAKRITYGAYDSGEKPIISARSPVPGWNTAENWQTSDVPNVWKISFQCGIARRTWLSGVEYPALRNSVVFTSTYRDISSTRRFICDFNTASFYVYSVSNPAQEYSNIEVPYIQNLNWPIGYYQSWFTLFLIDKNYVTIQNLDIQGGHSAIAILSSSYIIVENSKLGCYSNANGITALSTSYLDSTLGSGRKSSYGIIRRNTIDSCLSQIPLNLGKAPEMAFDGIANIVDHWEIHGNTVMDWAHDQISVSGNYNKVYNNYMTSRGVGYGRGISMSASKTGENSYNEWYNNLIIDTSAPNQIGGDHNSFHHNVIVNVVNSPERPYPGGGTGVGFSFGPIPANGVSVYNQFNNNIIYKTDETGIFLGPFNIEDCREDMFEHNEVINNILIDTGRNPHYYGNSIQMGYWNNCSRSNVIQNNIFLNQENLRKDVTISYFREILSVDKFNKKDGLHGDIISGNIEINPLFEDIARNNFHILEGSPAINAGIDVGLTDDYYGNPIPQGNAPDIGVHEYG